MSTYGKLNLLLINIIYLFFTSLNASLETQMQFTSVEFLLCLEKNVSQTNFRK